MARRLRRPALETRAARLRLSVRKKPHAYTVIATGISLGYRRCQGPGRWVVRVADGHGRHWIKNVALADDHEEADGEHVLTWWQAQDAGRRLARGQDANAGRPATVADALDDYARDLEKRGGAAGNVSRARHHLSPVLLSKPVALLTVKELRRWRDALKAKPATLNRTLTAVKAALNLAAAHDPRILNREAWRTGLAGLPDSYSARNVILTEAQIRALVAGGYAEEEAFGLLLEVAAVTGARVSQLARLDVADLQAERTDPRLMMPSSRKGRSRKRIERRPVPITAELGRRLAVLARGRGANDPLLARADGLRWRPDRSEHLGPFAKIAGELELSGVTMYALRHSSIVRALLANVPARVVAAQHDTSVLMLERTYSQYILDHSDAVARRGLIDLAPPSQEATTVVPLAGRRS